MSWQPEKQYPQNPSQNQWQAPPPQSSPNPVYPPSSTNGLPFNGPITVFNSRNLPYVRGETNKLSSQGSRIVAIALIAVAGLLGLLMAFVWLNDILNDNDLSQKGVPVVAQVVERHYSTGRYGSVTFYLTYSFTLNYANNTRKVFSHEQTVDEPTYNSHPPRATITVRYLSSNPEISQIPQQNRVGLDRIGEVVIALFCLIVAGGMTWATFNDIDLNNLLAEKGQPIIGTINNAEIVRRRGTIKNLIVNYSFITPVGYPIYKNYTVPFGAYQKNLQVAPGTPVGIVYADDKHFKLV